MKETYERTSLILNAINCETYKWQICGDLKVVGLLLGLQGGFTKYCFFCFWDTRATHSHYQVKEWPQRDQFISGQSEVKNIPLLIPKKVLLPPLHIEKGRWNPAMMGIIVGFLRERNQSGI